MSAIPAEMHIFQCVNVRAREVVEDIKAIMAGKGHHQGHGRRNVHDEIDVGDLNYDVGQSPRIGGGPTPARAALATTSSKSNNHDNNDTSSNASSSNGNHDRYERDVNVLNRCFDDIEKFIARLQHAAAAFRELEKRRRSRKSKRRDLGDGMLSMRAKPPPEREFVDVLQKFKLSFNLLARLRAHIHDPNAPELVHFLFTPLALIVDASHDSHYGPNLPSKVLAPLLKADAVELLVNCLTSKESELWHSLGEVWYVPAEEWKGYVPPYRPVFMDGWSPSGFVEGGSGGHPPLDQEEEELLEEEEEFHPRRGQRGGYGGYPPPPGPPHPESDIERRRASPSASMASRFEAQNRDFMSDLLAQVRFDNLLYLAD